MPTRPVAARLPIAIAAILATLVAVPATSPADERSRPAQRQLTDDLLVRVIAPGVWLHTTFDERDGARVDANGLLVTSGRVALLIDTGWRPEQTRRVLEWAERVAGRPVEHVIVTHAHDDRGGGLAAVPDDVAIVQGHALTAERLPPGGRGLDWTFEFHEVVDLGGEKVVLFYPGHGHAPDNIVVWFPDRDLLFGGCLVRPLAAESLGFTGDADLAGWATAVRRVIRDYRDVAIVVPGHGAPGGPELLARTMELIEEAVSARTDR